MKGSNSVILKSKKNTKNKKIEEENELLCGNNREEVKGKKIIP